MNAFEVSVVTPSGTIVSDQYEMVVAQTEDGEIGILANHMPLVTPLAIGGARLTKGDKTEWLAVSGGFLEVSGNHVTILAEAAEKADSIDEARAEKARKRAEARIATKADDLDLDRAQISLKRAIARINAAGHR